MGYLDDLRAFTSQKEAEQPLTKPTKPGSVSFVGASVTHIDPVRTLGEWHDKLRRLDLAAVPDGMEKGEWIDLCDDAWWLYEHQASVAVRQGWTAQGLWGVRVGYPAGGGLAQFLRTSRKVLFADGAAYVSRFGVTSRRATEMGHGLPLIWELRP